MKRRVPASLSSAASQMCDNLGAERMAEIVGRSPTLIYKWADPDLSYYPNLQQALELDTAFIKAGHGAPPFLTAYATLLKQRSAQGAASRGEDALATAVQMINVACEILSEISGQVPATAKADPAKGPLRCAICENLRRLNELQAALSWTIENSVAEQLCPLRRKNAEVECAIGATAD